MRGFGTQRLCEGVRERGLKRFDWGRGFGERLGLVERLEKGGIVVGRSSMPPKTPFEKQPG